MSNGYRAEWLAYWQSFSAYLTSQGSNLRCDPKPESGLDLKPRGAASHITVRYSVRKRCVVTELTFRGPGDVSNANYEQVAGMHQPSHPELDWNKEEGSSESHIRHVLKWRPVRCNDDEHKEMMKYGDLFLSWMI